MKRTTIGLDIAKRVFQVHSVDMRAEARDAVAWTRSRLSAEQLHFLAALQLTHTEADALFVHAGAMVLEQIEAVLGGEVLPREQLEAAAATYLVYYQNHIRTEDTTILARAGEHLTAEDWEAVRAAVPVAPDPLFGANPLERFRELRRQIAQEASGED